MLNIVRGFEKKGFLMVCIIIIQDIYDEAKISVKNVYEEKIQYFTVKVSIHSSMTSIVFVFIFISYV